ncbi:MAG TPA: ROK family protein [Actinomycetaceae bacterium]|nr:ROK family protein [Actinomycetaceae bacterium]
MDELLEAGFIAPAGEASSTGGRPPATFAFNPSTKLVLAADLGASHARFAVTDLAATVLAEEDMALPIAEGPVTVLDTAAARLRALVESIGRPLHDVAGVGVGLPGPVEHERGRAINPPIMPGWDGYDVPGHLTPLLHAPIFVDNDVNIMALGEHAARWLHVKDLVFIKVSSGIGAGIILDGALRRGALGAAGDLGHIAVARGATVPCRCGNTGCLEAIAGGIAVSAALREQGLAVDGPGDIVDLVRAGNLSATQAVRQAGRDLGEVLAGVVNLLNPSVIVIGGTIAEVGEYLLAGTREVVYSRSLPLATQHLRIVPAQTEGRAGVIGAAQIVAQDVLSASAVDAALAAR